MPLIYPRHTDPKMQELIEGFGRVLVASGRAHHAVRNIVFYRLNEKEVETSRFMISVTAKNTAEKLATLCAGVGWDYERLIPLTAVCERFAALYEKRNRIIHDEWWIWPGSDSPDIPGPADQTVLLRFIDRKTGHEEHDENWTSERLTQLADDLDTVADDLDSFAYQGAP